LLLDTLVFRVVEANRRHEPVDLEFEFNTARQTIGARVSKLQPLILVRMLRDVASTWNFKGVLEFELENGGVRGVTIAREHHTPSDGPEAFRWDDRDLESDAAGMPSAESSAASEDAIASSANAVSSLIIPSAVVAAAIPSSILK
jgi:hypothetical protein